MSFLDTILQEDRGLLIFLNNLGNEYWDTFWLSITNKFIWIPMYLLLLYLLFSNFGWKKTLFTLFFLALLIAFVDQFANLIKLTTHRLRPNNDVSLQGLIRVIKHSGGFSFFSAHAANSTAVSVFLIANLYKYCKPILFIIIWPVLFSYSRIYLGVHYPLDVIGGLFTGLLFGYLFYKTFQMLTKKLFLF